MGKVLVCLVLCGFLAGATASTSGSTAPIAHGFISLNRGTDMPEDPAGVADDDSSTSFAEMTNYRNTQYTGRVYVGSPPQPFDVILDTGSANFWVYSEDCTSPACQAHHRFDHQASSTYSTNQTTFFVKYGSGRINGILSQDNIQLGSLVVPQQIFGSVTRETGSAFMWGKYDGILGLAFPTLAIEGSVPVLDTIIQQGVIPPMFSFFFSSGKTDSAFFVGGVPASYSRHTFNWHSVIRKGYWEIGLDDLLVGDTSLAACPKHSSGHADKRAQKFQNRLSTKTAFARPSDVDQQSFAIEMDLEMQANPSLKFPENDAQYSHDLRCKAAVDTGTSLITGPSESIAKLQALMGQVTRCDDLSGMPTVTFVIDGINYPLTPEQYVLQFEADDGQPASCLLGFKALDVPPPRGPLWVLGDVFMRAYFSVFDRSQNRIGFTKADVSPNAPYDPSPANPNLTPLPIGIDTDKQLQSPASETNTNTNTNTADVSTSQFEVQAVNDQPQTTTYMQEQEAEQVVSSRHVTRHEQKLTPAQNLLHSQEQHAVKQQRRRENLSDEDDFWQQY